MLQILDTIVSLDLLEEYFMCDLEVCKGECCVQGDAGAPVEEEEVARLEAVVPQIWDLVSAKARKTLNRQGVVYKDVDNEYVTSIVEGRECAFAYYDKDTCCKCAIDEVARQGKTSFCKPVSCHLYPVRVARYNGFRAVNYHRWEICRAARELGRKEGVRVYQFLKEPLIRKFGEEWYDCLCKAAGELEAGKLK